MVQGWRYCMTKAFRCRQEQAILKCTKKNQLHSKYGMSQPWSPQGSRENKVPDFAWVNLLSKNNWLVSQEGYWKDRSPQRGNSVISQPHYKRYICLFIFLHFADRVEKAKPYFCLSCTQSAGWLFKSRTIQPLEKSKRNRQGHQGFLI